MDLQAEGEFDGTLAAVGDVLRVRPVPETEALGLAGLTGEVRGQSVPSTSGVEVVGHPADDWAVHVHFDARDAGFWFAPHLLEPLEADRVEFRRRGRARDAAAERARQAREAHAHPNRPAERSPSDFLGRLLDRLWPG
jgi:hypothetical protein